MPIKTDDEPEKQNPQIETKTADSTVNRVVTTLTANSWKSSRQMPGTECSVSANEVTSLSALIAYVAHRSGQSEFRVERRLADRFNVPNVTCLPSAEFDSAIRYLVDSENL